MSDCRKAVHAASVLVVDDDDDVRAVAVATFEDLGLTVYEASTGSEALRLLE